MSQLEAEDELPMFEDDSVSMVLGDALRAFVKSESLDAESSIQALERAAETGNAEAQFLLGTCCREGIREGSEFDWFRAAAKSGHVEAMAELAFLLYLDGEDEEAHREAVKWARRAADKGHADSQYYYGFFYAHGIGVTENKSRAFQIYRKAARLGHHNAQNALGRAFFLGEGTRRSPKDGVYWYEKSALQGNPTACANLGLAYLDGDGIRTNIRKAVHWLEKGAAQEDERSALALGDLYYTGKRVKRSVRSALRYWKIAANELSGEAWRRIGDHHRRKSRSANKEEERFKAYKEGSSLGDLDCVYELGRCFEEGIGCRRNRKRAKELYKRAADRGHSGANQALDG